MGKGTLGPFAGNHRTEIAESGVNEVVGDTSWSWIIKRLEYHAKELR
jgi:hypothetical protein